MIDKCKTTSTLIIRSVVLVLYNLDLDFDISQVIPIQILSRGSCCPRTIDDSTLKSEFWDDLSLHFSTLKNLKPGLDILKIAFPKQNQSTQIELDLSLLKKIFSPESNEPQIKI
ncbi:hypothetical protein V1477_014651 [Vespula maculifrons]|uniref:Uncharacterized protein n=1 Tax=Vespula maculifrons TaxID=7453 RepID=A0ABD2BI25_VESMC